VVLCQGRTRWPDRFQCHAMITRRPLLPAAHWSRSADHNAPRLTVARRAVTCATETRTSSLSVPLSAVVTSNTRFILKLRQQICSFNVLALCSAALLSLTSLPCDGASVLANKPTFSADYAAVVRKREGKAKSNLPSAREAEALLEINEDLFTTEALEGMSR